MNGISVFITKNNAVLRHFTLLDKFGFNYCNAYKLIKFKKHLTYGYI